MKHFDLEIGLFLDKELDPIGQKELFKHLSECSECSDSFSESIENRESIREYYNSLEPEGISLPTPVIEKSSNLIAYRYRVGIAMAVAATIVLFVITVLQQSTMQSQKVVLATLQKKLNIEKMNSANRMSRSMQPSSISVRKPMTHGRKMKNVMSRPGEAISALKKTEPQASKNEYNYDLKNTQLVSITKNDFISPQIVGN